MKLRNLLGTLLRSNISRSTAYLCPSGVDTRIFVYICLHTSLLRVYVAHVRSRSWCLAKEVSSFKAEQVTATNIEQNAAYTCPRALYARRPRSIHTERNEQKGGVATRVYRMDEKCLKCSNVTQEIEEVERVFSGLKKKKKIVSSKARLDMEMHPKK